MTNLFTDHPASDDVGVDILGAEETDFWKDHKGAKVNAHIIIRVRKTRLLFENCLRTIFHPPSNSV